MTFDAYANEWWPILYILIAGWIATDMWRWIGVLLGNRIDENAEILVYVRAVATALVAGVIAQLILFPSGALAQTAMVLRIIAAIAGFCAYLAFAKRIIAGVTAALIVLVSGMFLGF